MKTKTAKPPVEKVQSHTPGPWKLKEGDVERGDMSDIIAADKTEGGEPWRVAYVLCESRNKHQRAEDIANARLIAAAPDLLAALKQIAADWYAVSPSAQVPDEINVDKHWDAAVAAIAKASGR